ncbi:zf-HC2 domain-containing protein [Actinacidiphila soli]|uniref:zf-HC2 domain-containing protein n=1 Tax=Actinacidiphila soli TaxID=2487275 RepID=UPI000FC9B6E6|nr:zf-HC2 domain-containing protein [Actinacidiphila soli]
MNGTGEHLTPAEHHLGDRLAAFVDGELHDDARERVLAHLATCPGCKAAANDQRQLKNAVAAAAPPALSADLLARLQGLPGGDDHGSSGGKGGGDKDDQREGVIEATSLGGQRLSGNVFGRRRDGFIPAPEPTSGFRIHEVERPGNAKRGRRFAFAAAGAFSMAAIALGGALPLEGAADIGSDDPGSAVTPLSARASDVADVRGVRGTRGQAGDAVSPVSAPVPSASPSASAAGPASPGVASTPVVSVARPLVLPDTGQLVTTTPRKGSRATSSASPTPTVTPTVPALLDSPIPLLGNASATP